MAVVSDPISDFLTRFKNASRAGNDSFSAPFSKAKGEIARILKEEGYILNYEVKPEGGHQVIEVKTKFVDSTPVLTDVKRVSKPGRRHYAGVGEIPRVLNGLGISIVSTSKGLMSGASAKKQSLGGEVLALVW